MRWDLNPIVLVYVQKTNKQTTDTRRHVHKIIGYVRTEQDIFICKLRRGASGDQSH